MSVALETKVFFKRAVVAAAFSPRLVAVLNESQRILKMLGTWPIIVHIGEENPSNHTKLEEAVARSEFRDHPPVTIVRAGQPADVLMDVILEYEADLIIAGALKKEGLFKYYLGSIARNLARYSRCSVLLLTDPQQKPQTFKKIHCAVDYDEESKRAVEVAAAIASLDSARDVYLTHSFRLPQGDEKRAFPENAEEIKSIYKQEDEKLKQFLDKALPWDIPYHARTLYENTKATTLNFARELEADLFVVPSRQDQLGIWDRLFPHELELALQDLPCSLLLVKKPT
jgi:nucleotide-binding universal stress UspA family protein